MLSSNDIAKLLEMKDVLVRKIENDSKSTWIHVEMPVKEHRCPHCGNMTSNIHDYREQTVRDLDSFGKEIFLRYRKRRYKCPICHKVFYEESPIVHKYQRNTQRLYLHVLESFRYLTSGSEIARQHHLSPTTVFRYLDVLSFKNTHLPEVLSLDEFKGNSGGERYNCILTDAKNHKVLDILRSRKEQDLYNYFLQFPERKTVKYVVIDMNGHFDRIAACCFPKALVIVDRYHVTRQVFWALDNVRKQEQKNLSAQYRKYFKRSRKLLYKSPNKLTSSEKEQLILMFEYAPRLGLAYQLKNDLLEVMHSENSFQARPKLSKWIFEAESFKLPEFQACLTCYHNWFDVILRSLDVPYSNGYTEGMNGKIKAFKRISFGMPNFNHLRTRILFSA